MRSDGARPVASTGSDVVREVEPQELLLDFLRDTLGLTGAKRSCDVQVCGACTVLVDGLPGQRVLLPRGRRRRTRGDDDRRAGGAAGVRAARGGFHPPRRRCSAASARRACCSRSAHCSSTGELPRRGGVKRHLAGNLCRCTGYRGIVEAVGELADAMTATIQETPSRRSGARTRAATRTRSSAARRSSSGDIVVPRMLHGKVLRSPVAARPHRLDRHLGAEEIPGVVCVLTGADLGDIDPY